MLPRIRVLALVPDPNELSIVSATAAQVDCQLWPRAQAGAILTTACLSLRPCRLVKATAHALIGAAANAQRGIKRPPEL